MSQSIPEQELNQLINQGEKLTFEESILIRHLRGKETFEYGKLYKNWRENVKTFIEIHLPNEFEFEVRLKKINEFHFNRQDFKPTDFDEVKRLILKLLNDILNKIKKPADNNKSGSNEEKRGEKHSSDSDETVSQSLKKLLVFYDKENDEIISMITEMLALLHLESIFLGPEEIINANRKEKLEKIKGYDGVILCIQEPIETSTQLINSICDKYFGNILLLWNAELGSTEFQKIQDCFDEVNAQEMEQRIEFNKDSINFKNNVKFFKALKNFSHSSVF